MLRFRTRLGFTLIELVFVIVVISFFVLFAASHQQRKGRQTTIEMTNVEMQNWLQAAASYYLEKNQWPRDEAALTKDNEYIRAEEQCSHWSGQGIKSCPNKALYHLVCPKEDCDPKKSKYFGVAVELPTLNAAQQLAALLPSSEIIDDDGRLQVAAYITIPAAISNDYVQQNIQQGWIANAGIVKTGNSDCYYPEKIYLPHCPSGYEGHYVQMFQKQRTGEAVGIAGPWDKCVDSYSDHPFIEFDIGRLNLSSHRPSVQVKHVFNKDKRQFQYHYYMTFCLPNGTWTVDDHHGNGRYETQCAGLWRRYNAGGASC